MTDVSPQVSTIYTEPLAVSSPTTLGTGPIFSSQDAVAGVVAAVMILGPLAMAAFAVGRY
jgi:hypothetical protein